MRRRSNVRAVKLIAGAAVLALAIPVVAQQAPESLLPPGFGDAPQEEPRTPAEQRPAVPGQVRPATPATGTEPPLSLDLAAPVETGDNVAAIEELTEEERAERERKYDLPDSARRSLERIGPLTPETRGLGPDAFGTTSGKFLATLMKESRAPIASRWASILLRRTLLSATETPGDIEGADWAAERAWLLLRMGEADAARLMVQSIDNDRFTPRLYAVAMQTYLATADPAGLCPLSAEALRFSKEPGWMMSKAICASFSGDQGSASGALNQAQRRGTARGIDYRLAEKVVGAGFNARRSVKIEWEGVDSLTAWRFGLATATNVDIPDALWNTAGPQVRAWQARAAMLSPLKRQTGVETAARLGVFSSDALVAYYSLIAADPDAPDTVKDRTEALRAAYAARTVGGRLEGMRRLWKQEDDQGTNYVGLIAVARAAAALPVAEAEGQDVAPLIAAMLSAGYDRSAARWAPAIGNLDGDGAQDAWALLAVGAPSPVVDMGSGRISSYIGAAGELKGRFLLAGLAGLSRVSAGDAQSLAEDAGLSLAPRSRWARAIAAAAQRREQGTVALLAAVGMQVGDWRRLPPEHLYHIVAALHRVGLNPEARMIAAEAIARV